LRSIFLKVFLWFWLSTVLVIGALLVTIHLTRTENTFRPPHFINSVLTTYGRKAAAEYERGGQVALADYLQTAEQETGARAHLFDANGNDLSGGAVSPLLSSKAAQTARTGQSIFEEVEGRMLEVRAVPASGGGNYAYLVEMPRGGPPPGGPHGLGLLSESGWTFFVRLLVVILTAGALCYLLARYITTPVVKLREVTRQVTEGDLSARVGPRLGRRRDELAAMGHDFDTMATRVETLVSAQTRLLRDISHELRSPLARLSVALDLARKRAGAAATADLDRIEREAKRLNEMIGQLLTLSRSESDANGHGAQPLDLAALVREVGSDADFEAQAQGRAVEVVECEECRLKGTASLLRSAVENVVRNAVRYTPEGTAVKLSLHCARETGGADAAAVIRIRDEGPGVPEEALPEIFRPFYRMDDSRTRETGGTGLGLAITERAVRLHGGTVKAANLPGGGFTVEIRLPLHADA
jgi:signal transduction histidine kinase